MEENEAKVILEQLRTKELTQYRVKREDFLQFREVLVKQEDAINFRGNAQHEGETIYTYEPNWTK
ncbi:hypothetical protein [Halalkalibacter hemicellulosilyticus]|uniref:Uncharacterized protein n=1 Tax=Halalkalibacter hemicellulosilyticusJCM 9152 TaxID=1236971 RepID=W4QG09_9BACI|nr:hypothetical protein [Halalkalibacter hemicellulosilyticus]GAE30862.1 hypothetical protein JCM9152_2286 [Halalkalibacter hemicellulosilyticusJCM 9152]